MTQIISFSIGCLWRQLTSKNRDELVTLARRLPIKGVELNNGSLEEFYAFELSGENLEWVRDLQYVSIHAPCAITSSTIHDEAVRFMDRLWRICKETRAKTIMMHPDFLPSQELLSSYDLPISLENMVPKHRISPAAFDRMLSQNPRLGLCIDVSHAYLHSSNEVAKLISKFRDRISQFHFSGTYRKKDHQSLRTVTRRFLQSIEPIKTTDAPIVIEEDMPRMSFSKVEEEVRFVNRMFSTKQV